MPFAALAGATHNGRAVDDSGIIALNAGPLRSYLSANNPISNPLDVAEGSTLGHISRSPLASSEGASNPSIEASGPGQSGLRAPGGGRDPLKNPVRRIGFARNASTVPRSALAPRLALQSGGGPNAIAGGAVVRHAVAVNTGRVEGSIRQLLGESVILNGGSVVTGDLLAPGTPQLILNGNPSIGAIVDGSGSATPTNYSVIINSGVQLGRLVRRTDPVTMPSVAAPPASTGTRSVAITTPGQSPGDFSTLRDLTLNSNVGIYSIPPGAYRNFIANGGAGFSLGVAGSTQPSVYNLATLIVNGSSQIQVVGPVVVTIGSGLTINASVGSSPNPLWLVLRVASGGVTLNGGSFLSGVVVAPSGTVIINGSATLKGTVFSDRLTVNGGGLLQAFGDTAPPSLTIDSPCQNAITTLAQFVVTGTYADSTPATVRVNGTVASQSSGSFNSTVTLSDGANTITAVATDIFNNSTQVTRNITRVAGPNQAPSVNAGPDLTVFLPGGAILNGATSDDGLPTCATPSVVWSKVSGPGDVTFADSASAVTPATFSLPGDYVLRLSSSDSELTASDDVTVHVFPPNQPPVVNAGPNQAIELPNTAALNGSVTDDGLPPGSTLTIAWSKVSGPGTVSFSNPNEAVTTAAFSQPGSYLLQLNATDTQYATTASVEVAVAPENQPPQVNAGPNQSIELPTNSVTLNGAATDDGLPAGSTLTIAWSKVSGPGTVTFSPANQAVTTATFFDPGTYVLRLSADDTRGAVTSDVTVTVIAENQPPQVNAGPDLTITLPASATLAGSATDDGLPAGSTLVVTWSKVSGPGTVTFASPNSASTTATFDAAGIYVLRLTASDSALTSSDDVTVTVIAENQPPQVNAGPDLTVTLPAAATLNGTATDDGLPPGSTLTITWSQVSGPGTATFANASAAQTTATFDAAGTYVLRLTASDGALTSSDEVTVTVQPSGPVPVAAFNVPGVRMRPFSTVIASSGNTGANVPARLLDFDANTSWQTLQALNQFVTIQFNDGERLIDGIQLLSAGTGTTAVKNFEVQVSSTSNAADFVTAVTGVYQNTGQMQRFDFPGGPIRARFAKLIAKDNYGGSTIVIATFNLLTAGDFESVVTLTASNNVALAQSPSLLVNGARVVEVPSPPEAGNGPNLIFTLQTSGGPGWGVDVSNDGFVIVELAGGRIYTLSGIRLFGSVKDFEIWVSATSADATAFTRVLVAATLSTADSGRSCSRADRFRHVT